MFACLDTTNTELNQGAQHLAASNFVCRTADSYLDQQTVIVRLEKINHLHISMIRCAPVRQTHSNLSTRETRACVETNTVAAGTTVDLNFTRIRLEVLGGVLSGNTALDGKAALGDCLLGKTKLRQGCARSDLDLCRDDVDTSYFLWQTMSGLRVLRDTAMKRLPVMVCST